PTQGPALPTQVVNDAMPPPVDLLYRTFSSPVSIRHVHVPQPGSFKATASQDAPHIRVHTVTKPIIQELNEIIAPQRLIRQQVVPVQANAQTLIARRSPAPLAVAPVALGPIAGPLAFGPIGGAFLRK